MSNEHDYLALDWVKGEIEETLKQARQSLEAYVSNPEDSTRMRFCLTYLHQVYGTLQMVEFYGAALLAEEMEQLAQAILNGEVARIDDAEEVLMRSILQLPSYLEKVRTARRDLPVVILPLLNDLRATRGDSLLSETALFAPNISSGKVIAAEQQSGGERVDNPVQLLRRLRQMYQISLVGLIRNSDLVANLGNLAKVLAKLERLAGSSPSAQLWWVSGAIAEGLSNGSIEAGTSIKMLLGMVDRQIKEAIDTQGDSLKGEVPEELMKNLLYYVAKSSADSPRIKAVKEAYSLQDALLAGGFDDGEQQMKVGPGREAMESVVAAISEEINRVKESLDIFVRKKEKDFSVLSQLIPNIKQIADTLAVLGLGTQRRIVKEQIDEIEWCVSNSESSGVDTKLLDVAGAFLYVEATLSGIAEETEASQFEREKLDKNSVISPEQLGKAQSAVMRECRAGLEKAKDSVVEFIVSQWEHGHLDQVPELLKSVRGGLLMIPLQRPAQLLGGCIAYIQEKLLDERFVPDWKQMDTLADAITSIEYYLERLSEDSHTDDYILDIAEESISALGYPVEATENIDEVEEITQQAADFYQVNGDESEDLDNPLEEDVEQEFEEIIGLDADSSSEIIEDLEQDISELDELVDEVEILDDEVIEDNVIEVNFDGHTDSLDSQSPEPSTDGEADDEDMVDDEIIEIFVEEVEEVIETINEMLPRWEQDHNDSESLTEVRRAFHTLKGSGRLVGAMDAGELSWSIENMLNRIIDGTISVSDEVFHLIHNAVEVTPTLVDAFKLRQPCPYDLTNYQQAAFALADGDSIDISALSMQPAGGAEETIQQETTQEEAAQTQEIIEGEAAEESEDKFLLDVEDEPGSSDEAEGVDPVLLEIFTGEAKNHLISLRKFLSEHNDPFSEAIELDDSVLRALHTLKGSAYMAGIMPIADVAAPTERFVKELASNNRKINSDLLKLLQQGVDLIDDNVNKMLSGEEVPASNNEAYLEELERLKDKYLGDLVEQESIAEVCEENLNSIFLIDGMDMIQNAEEVFNQWNQNRDQSQAQALHQLYYQLKDKAVEADLPHAQALCAKLASVCQFVADGGVNADELFFQTLQSANEALVSMIDSLAVGQFTQPANEAIIELDALIPVHSDPEEIEVAGLDESIPEEELSGVVDNQDSVEDSFADSVEDSPTGSVEDSPTGSAEDSLTGSAEDSLTNPVEDSFVKSVVQPPEDFVSEADFDEFEVGAAAGEELLAQETGEDDDAVDGVVDTDQVEVEAFDQTMADEGMETAEAESDDGAGKDIADFDIPDRDPELLEIFLEEASDTLDDSAAVLERWMAEPDNLAEVEQLQRDLHTLKGGARMSEIREVGDLAHYLENLYEGFAEKKISATGQVFDLLNRCHDALAVMVEDVRETGRCGSGEPLIEEIKAFSQSNEQQPAKKSKAKKQAVLQKDLDKATAFDAKELDNTDAEIVTLFIEEADEILEGVDRSVGQWQQEPENEQHGHELQRLLHTLKGGARLAGLKRLGNMTHDFETFLIENQDHETAVDDSFIGAVRSNYDQISNYLDQLKDAQKSNLPVNTDNAVIPVPDRGQNLDAAELIRAAIAGKADAIEQARAASRASASQEMIRVPADLLESLVNLAGETSINRARIEKEILDFTFTLEELGTTIDRLKEQMRRLNIETEAQILYRHEALEGVAYNEFDPLEMDRYSQLNQLSRSLTESAGDLLDLRETMLNKARDTETLLVQQARVNTELQEGLMRTRLVPFSRLAPRLRRIVRQVGSELGKSVELEIINAEGEIDRAVLERMVSPLEHMLRNAVDHGIEDSETRRRVGKDPKGRVTLHLVREGADIVLRLSDDGGGIDVESVRKKAIQRELMKPGSHLPENEIMQFIFQPGFSTASEVTQISGRGVGMDVVHSEIKQLGGSLRIHSAQGVGSQFTVRLPFTVAVNRALMVKVSEENYAIPLSHVEGIVRVSPYELETYYQSESSGTFEYAGQTYRLQYLGAYVNNSTVPNLQGMTRPLPVLLIRGAEQSVALQVDSIIGSREIVVKSVGPQLSTVSGISGATILGDGSVVIILDLPALIRSDLAERLVEDVEESIIEEEPIVVDAAPVVMVVDDSVTVRKVTSRVLERHGYEVLLARDGVDAVTVLQEHTPNVILLDIEMPRMDGFEVASHIRHDSRLKNIPIIMITSRTGQKHRERALSLGVNEYLGKPFQETELLQHIGELVGKT